MRSFKFKLVVVLLSLLWWIVPCLAQNPTVTSRLDFKNQASAPSNPDEGVSSVYVTSAGVVHVRLSDGTDVPVLTGSIDTDDVAEGSTNLYFTNTRARSALSAGTGISYNSTTGEISLSGGGGGGALSALTAATASNDINNGNNSQIWRWNTLAGTTGLQLASNSTAAASNAQVLFDIALSGANSNSTQTTIAGRIANTHTGTGSTNVALSLSASGGTNNYALIVPSGRVGIGTSTPLANVDLGSDATNQKLLIYSNVNTRYGLGQDGSGMRIFGSDSGVISFGTVASSDGSAYTERARLTTTLFDLTGSGQKLAFSGNGGITFGGTGGTAKIDFNTTVDAKSILFYHSSNTQNGIGTASGQQRYFVASGGSVHSFGILSTGDASTYTEKAAISETALNLSGSSQNLTFTGNGGIILGGGTTLNSGSKISFGTGVNSQAIALYVNNTTKHVIGVNSGQTIFAHPTGAKTSIGAMSTGDGTTFSPYFDFEDNGKLTITQGNITSNKPYINHTVTTNEGSTQFILDDSTWTDTASASTSLFSRKRVGSTVMFSLRKDGFGYFASHIGANITSPSVIINPFDSPNAGTIIQSAGFVSSQRTGQVGFHMFNGGGVAEWILTQPASGTSSNFQINKVVSNVQTKLFELTTDGDLKITEGGLSVKEGANKSMGVATLSSGTVTVNTTKVTANSRIFLTKQGSATKHGILVVSARTAGTSFTITSVDGADGTATQTGDDGQVAWQIVEPN